MRKNNNLKIASIVTYFLLIAIGLSACGDQAANNVAKPNANNSAGNTNANLAANKATAPKGCDTTMDDAIIKSMKDGVEAKSDLLARKRHFNFNVYGCKVELVGYMDDIKYFKQLYALAVKNTDVQQIDISGLWLTRVDAGPGPVDGACPGNAVPCGDICLPEGQKCNTDSILLTTAPSSSPKP